jgi:predicted enzyme related to lactoylglutathione lyase
MTLASSHAFSGFSAADIPATKAFYADVLGLETTDEMGGFGLTFPNGHTVYVYPKDTHEPATFTVLNFPVDDLDATVTQLTEAGVTFVQYDGFDQEPTGIARGNGHGPDIAWFTDPAGNILSVMQS